jgi:hypothetical protein
MGMKDYEILSRATAFLLSVDPPDPDDHNDASELSPSKSPFSHLSTSQDKRNRLIQKQDYLPDPAGGPARQAFELNWLEFCPSTNRPLVHVLASSHVLSPWLWKKYYPQPWLEHVTQEQVVYSLEVYQNDSPIASVNNERQETKGSEPLATFALNPYPIHHPANMDLAIIHLKNEESALKTMKELGVKPLHLRDSQLLFQRDDKVVFDGFEITEDHYEQLDQFDGKNKKPSDDDTRVFIPYRATGNLIFASQDRILASTEKPLPEGLCGGPVLDSLGQTCCGIIEGIVPTDHPDTRMAGAASFIPHLKIKEFIDYAERAMLEKILPKNVFDKVVDLKNGKALNEKSQEMNLESNDNDGVDLDAMYSDMIANIKKSHTNEEVEAILGTIEREQREVLDLIEREGGDLDAAVAKVRSRTIETQQKLYEQLDKLSEEELENKSENGEKESKK